MCGVSAHLRHGELAAKPGCLATFLLARGGRGRKRASCIETSPRRHGWHSPTLCNLMECHPLLAKLRVGLCSQVVSDLSLYIYISLSLCLSLCVYLYRYVYIYISLSLSLSIPGSLSLSLSVALCIYLKHIKTATFICIWVL